MSSRLETAFYDLGRLDLLAEKDSPIHRLDPRAKVVTALLFIVYVVSFDKYEISRLLPFFLFPAFLIGVADLPFLYLLRKLAIISPFVLVIGIFNPFLDREIILHLGPLQISGGWISFVSILLRFLLTVGAALLLIATTGFPAICMALEKLGAPRIFAVQLLMLYRYIFVLIEEAIRMLRAYALRATSDKKVRYHIFKQILGNLLLRTIDRAQRIHLAMLSRAFTGEIRIVQRYTFARTEFFYTVGLVLLFTFIRFIDISALLGNLLLGTSL
jgi:cobalt/nickel transport system permease protein